MVELTSTSGKVYLGLAKYTLDRGEVMRPVAQSFLRHPLSTLLGSEASVRVLREMALHGGELTTTQLARRTALTDQSVRNVLAVLRGSALLRLYGQGRSTSYQLDSAHPLAGMLIQLFKEEDARVGAVLQQVRDAAQRSEIAALWLFGSVARREDRMGSDLDLLLVVWDDDDVDRVADAFREAVARITEEHRLAVSVIPVGGEDILRLARTNDPFWREMLSDAQPLLGLDPKSLLSRLKRAERSRALTEPARG
jgi:predicted nucleotidyltransferase